MSTKKIIENRRKEFERLYLEVNPSKKINRSPNGYHQAHAQMAWYWFNTSREYVVIPIPMVSGADSLWQSGYNSGVRDSQMMIENDGYNVAVVK